MKLLSTAPFIPVATKTAVVTSIWAAEGVVFRNTRISRGESVYME